MDGGILHIHSEDRSHLNERGRRGSGHVGVAGQRFAVRVVGTLEDFDAYESGEPFEESNVPLLEAGVITQGDTIDDAFVLGSLPKITLNDVILHDGLDVDVFQVTAQDTGKLVFNVFYRRQHL